MTLATSPRSRRQSRNLTMLTRSKSSTILVTDAAALVPLGPRRFRQLAGLETDEGKRLLKLTYVAGRAMIDRDKALALIEQLRAERQASSRLRQEGLDRFAEQCERDPRTGERLCIEVGCQSVVCGRGKLCDVHSAIRAERRRQRCYRRLAHEPPDK